jgi:hypothetical protein
VKSHKAVRKARKNTQETQTTTNNNGLAEAVSINIASNSAPIDSEETVQYECCICRDNFFLIDGVVPCEEHFLCNDCVVSSFDAALNDMDLFPAQCCKELPRRLVEHVLSPEVIQAYKARAKEHFTHRVLRVYCINEDCGCFIPSEQFDNHHAWYTVARCDCGTNTCVGCKTQWEDDHHRCVDSDKPGVKPEWLPEYSITCRIKQCPSCRLWIEHKEACNHMTCCYCRHEFCFICKLPWDGSGFHDAEGCPSYGDPAAGYDEEGFERTGRGLHRDTGYNRNGFDRRGNLKLGHTAFDGYSDHGYDEQSDNGDDYDHQNDYPNNQDRYDGGDFDGNHFLDGAADGAELEGDEAGFDDAAENHDEHYAVGGWQALEMPGHHPHWNFDQPNDAGPQGWINDVEVPVEEQADNDAGNQAIVAALPAVSTLAPAAVPVPAPTPISPPGPPSAAVRQQLRQTRRVPLFAARPEGTGPRYDGGCPSFSQLDCQHSWNYSSYYNSSYSYALCQCCRFAMVDFCYFCSGCGMVVCRWCSSDFRHRSGYNLSGATVMVNVILWAEMGIVPFRAQSREDVQQRLNELEKDGADWGLELMITMSDEELYQLQPFMYWDFGIQLMFEEVEWDMLTQYWITTVENVGFAGREYQMTFRLDTNPFAPLFWQELYEL